MRVLTVTIYNISLFLAILFCFKYVAMHKIMIKILYVIGSICVLSLPALTAAYADDQTIVIGRPAIKDSGNLFMNGIHLRLWGVDTLAPDQQCWEGDMAWCCGEEATMALKHFIHGKKMKCTIIKAGDENNPPLAQCEKLRSFRKKDLSRFLVFHGFATANVQDYKPAERKARKMKRGIWSSRFQSAADWRDGIQRFKN